MCETIKEEDHLDEEPVESKISLEDVAESNEVEENSEQQDNECQQGEVEEEEDQKEHIEVEEETFSAVQMQVRCKQVFHMKH